VVVADAVVVAMADANDVGRLFCKNPWVIREEVPLWLL
jgi:hypothetical protein